MSWVGRVIPVAALALVACGSSLTARTFEVTAPAVQLVQAYPVIVTDRSGLVTSVAVDMIAVADENGFTRQERASNILGRQDQVVMMWAGGGCDDRGTIEVDADAAGRVRLRLTRFLAPCAITVMDRVLMTFAKPVDARKIEVEHVEPQLPAGPG
jgi:hypothetical protein